MATLQISHMTGSCFQGNVSVFRRVFQPSPARIVSQPVHMSQTLTGKVVSTGMNKTAVVAVDRFPPHPVYKKRIRVTKKYFAHDEEEKCVVGDVVAINPCRPLSKNKRFVVSEVVKKSDL